MTPKPFKYNVRRTLSPEYTSEGVSRVGSTEQLVGSVQGKTASDLEERMSRAFDKLSINYEFRARISSLALGDRRLTQARSNLPGELEIDHLIDAGQVIPILVQGEIAHFMTPSQRLMDKEKQSLINEFGKSQGWHEVIEIPFTEIKSQEEADSVARRIANGTYIPTGVR
jgi:hypothetical protein